MQWRKTFKTTSRVECGLFYQRLIQGFEPGFFLERDDIPVMTLCGTPGKSFMIEVMMKEILDDYDAIDTIHGLESRTMFLESRPCEALTEMLTARGTIFDGMAFATLAFNSAADCFRARHGKKYLADYGANIDASVQFLRDYFKKTAYTPYEGVDVSTRAGMIFASTILPPESSGVWIKLQLFDKKSIAPPATSWSAKIHDIEIWSPKLRSSERFQKTWDALDQWRIPSIYDTDYREEPGLEVK